jgi:hypothetical protein
MLEKCQPNRVFFLKPFFVIPMLACSIRHLVLSQDQTLLSNLMANLEGEILMAEPTVNNIHAKIESHWPYTIIVDTANTPLDSAFFYRIRKPFDVAEIPMVIIVHESNPDFEEQLSLLSRVIIFHAHEEDWQTLPTFVEMLVDEYLRDPFYEQHPNLQTLQRLSQLWITQQSARIYYGRLNEEGTWEKGFGLTLHRGGVTTPNGLQDLEHVLCDPNPEIVLQSNNTLGDWLGVGESMYRALKHWTRPGFLRIRQWYSLQTRGPTSDVAKDLPLSLPTRKFLFGKHDPFDTIADRVRTLGLRNMQIESEIEILVRMGLYSIKTNTVIEKTIAKQEQENLPQVPPERWQQFLKDSLKDAWAQAQIPNKWNRFDWNASLEPTPQLERTLQQWTIFESLESPDCKRLLCQLKDVAHETHQQIDRWHNTFQVHRTPNNLEQIDFWMALSAMMRCDHNTACQHLSKHEHPVLKGLFLWLQCIKDQHDQSAILTHFRKFNEVLQNGNHQIPIFEAYACVMHMMLEHWPMANNRVNTLHNSHQTRMLRSAIQNRQIPSTLWVFHEW